MNKQDGGPAFPSQFFDERAMGMTLRDYFAAKAMQAILTNKPDNNYNWIAQSAYALADEMLESREQ